MNSDYLNRQFNQVSQKETQTLLLGFLLAALYVFCAFLIGYYQASNLFFQVIYLVSIFVFPWILLFFYKNLSLDDANLSMAIKGLLFFLIPAAFVLCFLYGFWSIFSKEIMDFSISLVYFSLYKHLILFLTLVVLSMAFLGGAFFLKRLESLRKNSTITLVFCFIPILLFDVMNNFDIEHYNAYLAPAIAVLNGKMPLVDVFCHYGACYLIFTVAYLFLPNNYAVAAAIVSVLNVFCWVTFLLIMRNMIKNPLYFVILAITSVFSINYLLGHSINMLPSGLCMRYLPTLWLGYFLLKKIDAGAAADKKDVFLSPYFNFLLLLNVAWSFETLVSLWIIYAAYLWLSPYTWRYFFYKLLCLFFWILGIYLILGLVYWVSVKELPRYDIYLAYILSYMNPYKKIGDRFLLTELSFFRDYYFWFFLAIMHGLCFFYFLMYRLHNLRVDIEDKKILFLNLVCIALMAYFILQPTLIAMMVSGYPSFILLFSILVREKKRSHFPPFRWFSGLMLFSMSLIFFISSMKSLFIEYQDFYKNGDILYTAFHKRGFTVDRFLYNLTHFCSKKQPSPGAGKVIMVEENTCKRNTYQAELRDLVKKWYPEKKEILLFHRDLIETLLENKKSHKIFVDPMNDALLDRVYSRMVKSAKKKVHEGDIVVVEKNLDIFPAGIKFLKNLSEIFDFILLEKTENFKVFNLKIKKSTKGSDLIFPLPYKKIETAIHHQALFNGLEVKMGSPALFDQDKETVWFVKKDMLNKTDVFWIWIDLGDLFLIEEIRIWRKVDFRKPNYTDSLGFDFIHDFNIQLSQDNKYWVISSSEKNFQLKDRYYYQLKINDKKSRYIKINILAKEMKDFAVSEIEVFGKRVMQDEKL